MALVEAERITVRYGARRVLNGVSLRLDAGTLTLVTGRSGSGKSTLMSVLAGLVKPQGGSVHVNGEDVHTLDGEARAAFRLETIGLVFQSFRLIPDLTVEENVRLPMTLARKRRRDVRGRARELLQAVGLGDHLDVFPETLSGGEMQRVAVARALANRPRVLLADEPTANLDEANARQVLGLLHSLAQQGQTVLVASHDPLAVPYAERVLHLVDGRFTSPAMPHPGASAQPVGARTTPPPPSRAPQTGTRSLPA